MKREAPFQRQAVQHVLFRHLMDAFDAHIPNFKPALNHRADGAHRRHARPQDHGHTRNPPRDAQRRAASPHQPGPTRLLPLIGRLRNTRSLPFIHAMADRLGLPFTKQELHAALRLPLILATADSRIRSVSSS